MNTDAMIIIILAWRNVWKNMRRTVLTLLTIMVGCTMIIFMTSVQKGAWGALIEDAASTNTGHIQIHEKGFYENASIDYALRPSSNMLKTLQSIDDIQAYSLRVNASGLISFKDTTQGVAIQAVDPDRERSVTKLHSFVMPEGRYLNARDRKEIIIGEVLARNLDAHVGDTVSFLSQGFDGSIAAANLTIVGLIQTGNPEYDRSLLVMSLAQAQETFTMSGYVNSVVIRLKDNERMEQVRDNLRRTIGNKGIEIMGWDELMPELVQLIAMKETSRDIFSAILFMIVAFGVLNTIQMSVYERTREFGIIMAIGTKPVHVFCMVIAESIFIAFLGVVFGALTGAGISYFFNIHPLDYSRFKDMMQEWGLSITVFRAKLQPMRILTTSVFMFIFSVFFTIFPARRASRLNIIDAIRKL